MPAKPQPKRWRDEEECACRIVRTLRKVRAPIGREAAGYILELLRERQEDAAFISGVLEFDKRERTQ